MHARSIATIHTDPLKTVEKGIISQKTYKRTLISATGLKMRFTELYTIQ